MRFLNLGFNRKTGVLLLIVLLVLGLGYGGWLTYRHFNPGPNPTDSNPAGRNTIDITKKGFYPANYSISQGTGMTWINRDVKNHTVTFKDFDSGKMMPQDIFHHMFDKKGTYKYSCKEHPKEKGKIIVK